MKMKKKLLRKIKLIAKIKNVYIKNLKGFFSIFSNIINMLTIKKIY